MRRSNFSVWFKHNFAPSVFPAVLLLLILLSLFQIARALHSYRSSGELYDSVSGIAHMQDDEIITEFFPDKGDAAVPSPNSELSAINWTALQTINPDIIAWLIFDDAGIDYPVVRAPAEDPDYYLHHAFDRSASSAGCVYVLPQQSPDFSDTNTFLFGHNMRDGSMFGSLKNIYNRRSVQSKSSPADYAENPAEKTLQLFLPDGRIFTYEIVSMTVVFSDDPVFSEPARGAGEGETVLTLCTCRGASGSGRRLLIKCLRITS